MERLVCYLCGNTITKYERKVTNVVPEKIGDHVYAHVICEQNTDKSYEFRQELRLGEPSHAKSADA